MTLGGVPRRDAPACTAAGGAVAAPAAAASILHTGAAAANQAGPRRLGDSGLSH